MTTESAPGDGDQPQFCPWCGAPSPYRPEPRTPLWQRAAEETGQDPPEVIQQALETEGFITACSACRRMSHVVAHEAHPAGERLD